MIDACYVGDVRDGLRSFIAAGIRAQTCVTSPPYWGLRDYGTAQWEGGGAGCDHLHKTGGTESSTLGLASGGHDLSDEARVRSTTRSFVPYRDVCGKCGARRSDRQIGLEPTIAEYVATMVDVFRLVREVLADDGTLWLNLGDSYAGGGRGGNPDESAFRKQATNAGSLVDRSPLSGMKPKDLCGIPWRVAFALQADGWYLRSDIIWHKPNPMPESVTDRPTKAHEYLFLLAKSERYYYDAAAIAEPVNGTAHRRGAAGWKTPDGWDTSTGEGGHGSFHKNGREKGVTPKSAPAGEGIKANESFHAATWDLVESRNRRTVWTVPTEAFPEAHFATFPRALVEPCIMAGSRPGDIVLDPFMGSGTVAQVAQDLGRRWIGCELNGEYVKMQDRRTAQAGLDLRAAAD